MADSRESKDQTLGKVIADARKAKGFSQKDLATRTGYGESGVSIARIETGVIYQPSDSKLEALADHLDLDVAVLRRLAVKPSGNRALAGPALRRANRDRVEALSRQAVEFQQEVAGWYRPLEKAREAIERDFLERLFEITSHIRGLPVNDLAKTDGLDFVGLKTSADREFAKLVNDYRAGVGRSLGRQVGLGVGGATAGGAAGAGAAFATYSAAAAFATASTGTAISGLTGAAATSATMAALGGGSIAAGGFGVAGGAAVLGGVIALPAAAVGGLAFYQAGKKWTAREQEEAAHIKEAEDEFDDRQRRIRGSFDWVAKAQAFLTLAVQRAKNRLQLLADLEQSVAASGEVDCEHLERGEQAVLRELLELAAITMTVLPLPVIATPDGAESVRKVELLEQKSRQWNDAVLDEAMAWFAR